MTSLLQAYIQCVLEHPHSLGIPSPHRGGPEILNSASFMSTFAVLFVIKSLLIEMNNRHYVYSFTETIRSPLYVHLCLLARLMINRMNNRHYLSLLLHRAASCRLNNYHKTNKCTNCM